MPRKFFCHIEKYFNEVTIGTFDRKIIIIKRRVAVRCNLVTFIAFDIFKGIFVN